jgi:AcrR family transcriptional regulator
VSRVPSKSPSATASESGRVNQRDRTRRAILEAATELTRHGKVPSVAEAAEAAAVSRATAYRYFPTQGALIRAAVDHVFRLLTVDSFETEDPLERVDLVASMLWGFMRANEVVPRSALLLSQQQWLRLQAGEDLGEPPIRRGGRLELIRAALAPLRGRLDKRALTRLEAALAMVIGIDARVVLRDICGLDEEEAEAAVRWVAGLILRAAMADEASADDRKRSRRRVA